MLLQGIAGGVASLIDFAGGIVANGLPLVGVSLALWLTIMLLQIRVPMLTMLVAAIHALTFVLVAGFLLAFAGGSLATALLGLLGYLFYRGGREILGLGMAFAIAYAALSIVLLVALPMSLYMLVAPGPGVPS